MTKKVPYTVQVAKSAYQLRHVSPSASIYQLGSHWLDFTEFHIKFQVPHVQATNQVSGISCSNYELSFRYRMFQL